jgi:hypothetical protein
MAGNRGEPGTDADRNIPAGPAIPTTITNPLHFSSRAAALARSGNQVASPPTLLVFAAMVAYGEPLTDITEWKKRSPYFIKANGPEAKKYPGFNPREVQTPEGLLIEYDVAVTLRDGVKMYVDIYRPAETPEKIPIVIAWTPVPPPL